MSRITLDLIRKRSEHNEGEISTLEEIALHQENIEKIELLDKTCRHLKILLLQNNLVSKIENLGRLKQLEYLNLALNNIEVIENLEGLESLKKLDLTVNFIGDLRSVDNLRCNEKLEQLFLMGNPCGDYDGYREYAIATLSQLKELDGTQIDRSERIKALQALPRIEGEIIRSFVRYGKIREAEKLEGEAERGRLEEYANGDKDEENEKFWKRTSRHTPEDRVAIAERVLRKQEETNRSSSRKNEARTNYTPKLFNPEGRPYNVNQPKVPFKLTDDEYSNCIVLEIGIYKYLDTVYVDVDVQSDYVRVTIKGKVLQLTLSSEVSIEGSTAKRNVTNGNLVITMPRLKPLPVLGASRSPKTESAARLESTNRSSTTVREYLEIGPATDEGLDFSKIVTRKESAGKRALPGAEEKSSEELESCEYSDIPFLE